MSKLFDRLRPLVGDGGVERLKTARVLVVGLGGVGGAAAETLIRSGVGRLTFVDGDVFEPSNLNRQLLATSRTVGMNKAAAAKARAEEISSDVVATAVEQFVDAENIGSILDADFDYCIDAIDDIKNKIVLIAACKARGVGIVSAMGAGNRLDCDLAVTDIYKTQYDPIARTLRRELKKLGITELDTVCACSPPLARLQEPASAAAPPAVMGAMLAGHVIKRLTGV